MDYKDYTFSNSEKAVYGLGSMAAVFLVSYLAYQSLFFSLICLPLAWLPFKMIKKKCIEKRKQQLLIEFREFLYSLIVCLGAGYSFENSLPHTVEELEMLYSGDSMIVEEIRHIHRRVTLGESAESAFRQFSERADCTAIHLFVSTLGIGLKQGGNLVEILKENGNMIIDQLATHQEIEVITAEKQFELKVLSCFPIFMIAVLDYSSPNYMAVLYQTWFGRIGMTLAMIVIGFGIWLGRELVMRHT